MIAVRLICKSSNKIKGAYSLVNKGDEFNIYFGNVTLVGRSSSPNGLCEEINWTKYLTIKANTIARCQYVFRCNLNGVIIEDLGATHNIEINDHTLKVKY